MRHKNNSLKKVTNEAENAVCMCMCAIESNFKGHCWECGAAFNGHTAAVFTCTHNNKQTHLQTPCQHMHIENRNTDVLHRVKRERVFSLFVSDILILIFHRHPNTSETINNRMEMDFRWVEN